MLEENAIKDISLLSDSDYEKIKNSNTDEIDEFSKMLEDDSLLREEHLANSIRANEFIKQKRQVAKEKYKVKNYDFLNKNSLLKKDLVFVSKYSPMIIANLSVKDINCLVGMDDVVYLEQFTNEKLKLCQGISLEVTGGLYNKNTLGYTGTGVNVGMIENSHPIDSLCSANVVDVNNNNIDDTWQENNINHATRVAEIIGGDNGYAPNCTIYSTTANDVASFYAGVELLLDYNVNVINMSAGWNGDGTYDSISRWADHITSQHNVAFVVAAGNTGEYLMEPAMAYNAISVGSFNDNNTVDRTGDWISSFSSYVNLSGYAEKPDIIAPGENIGISNLAYYWIDGDGYVEDVTSGTSFSAPQVTGTLAQLMYVSNNLKVRPSLSKALINVSGRYKLDTSSYNVSGIHTYSYSEGAGTLNAKIAGQVLTAGRFYYALGGTSTFPITKTFTVSSSDTIIRVALAWKKRSIFPIQIITVVFIHRNRSLI